MTGDGKKENQTLSSSDGSYTQLTQGYINYTHKGLNIRLGSQQIDTPLADSDHIRLIDNRFQAFMATYELNDVVLTIGSDRDGVLYVNGSSARTFSGALNSGGLDMFSIGVDYDSSSGSAGNPAQYFDGKIDEVAVWNDELTSAEVTAIYNSGNMLNVSSDSGNYASAANLKGYYRFNEGSGTSLQDNSSNSNTGTINGATWTAGFVSE